MTRDEWQAELVRLAMDAVERSGVSLVSVEMRDIRASVTERMAQAAQAIVVEVDEARRGERARLDRIDATARAVYAAHIVRFWYASFIGAYENAQALEETRAEWLAKRGPR